MPRTVSALVCLTVCLNFPTLPLSAQVITLAEGTPASLQIVSVPENNPNAPDTVVVQDVELLPIETTGRTLMQAADATRSRRVEQQGIARVELPQGGRLFRYRRQGGAFWGFLLILPDGSAHVVLEQPGTGAALADPFADRIGVAADGQHAVVPILAGGASAVLLDGSVYASTGLANRLAVAGNFDVDAFSVMVGPTAFFCQAKASVDVVLRCGLADGASPVDVSPPLATGTHYKPQMVMAGDGSRVVFLHGPSQQQQLWQVALTGSATVLPPLPSKYDEAGYLPEGAGEPSMLLNGDGTRLFFVDSASHEEMYLLDTTGVMPMLQITEDSIFEPYIGLHILPLFANDRLTVAIGDPALMDWYRVELAAAGGTVQNLTNTGTTTQPYFAGTLDPRNAVPVASNLLVSDQTAAGLTLHRVDIQNGGFTTLQSGLTSFPVAGSAVPGSVADLLVPSATTGDRLYSGTVGSLIVALPPGILLTPPVQGPLYAATWVHLVGNVGAMFFYFSNGLVLNGALEIGVEQLAVTPLGGTVVIGNPVRYLAPGFAAVMNRPLVSTRLCLSGASS